MRPGPKTQISASYLNYISLHKRTFYGLYPGPTTENRQNPAETIKLALVETRDDEAFVFMCEFLRADFIFYPFTKQKTRTCVRVSDDGQNDLRVSDTSKTSIHRMCCIGRRLA